MGVDHPYSNVRMHAGPSNHYFLPMGVLHKLPAFERMWPPVLPWAGGAILVHESNAPYFLTQGGVPGDGDYPLHINTAYSIELNNAVMVEPWGKEIRIMLEEDAFFDDTGVWYLDGRQTRLIEIPSRSVFTHKF